MPAHPSPAPRYRTVGVLGGMGALATVDFLHKLVMATPATRDQEHVPMLVRFCPGIPDRVDALLGRGPSPEPALIAAAQGLEQGGAQCVVMACNTAYAWYDGVARSIGVPLLHIVDAALSAASPLGDSQAVGLLATTGTLRSGIYSSRGGPGVGWIRSSDIEQSQWVTAGIHAVKAQRIGEGRELLLQAARALVDRGAQTVVMACTEIPLALVGADVGAALVDPTLALARACVAWAGSDP